MDPLGDFLERMDREHGLSREALREELLEFMNGLMRVAPTSQIQEFRAYVAACDAANPQESNETVLEVIDGLLALRDLQRDPPPREAGA